MRLSSAAFYPDDQIPWSGDPQPFVLIIKKDEDLFSSLIQCATKNRIHAASLSGLGAVQDVELAYYDLNTKKYVSQVFGDLFELVSLNGNISLADGKPFPHIHCAISKQDYSVIGGHLLKATVGILVEITVTPLAGHMERKLDNDIGLKLICPIR